MIIDLFYIISEYSNNSNIRLLNKEITYIYDKIKGYDIYFSFLTKKYSNNMYKRIENMIRCQSLLNKITKRINDIIKNDYNQQYYINNYYKSLHEQYNFEKIKNIKQSYLCKDYYYREVLKIEYNNFNAFIFFEDVELSKNIIIICLAYNNNIIYYKKNNFISDLYYHLSQYDKQIIVYFKKLIQKISLNDNIDVDIFDIEEKLI